MWTAVPFRTSVNRQDCRRGSGRIEQAAVEGRDGEHRVGGHRGRVELGVVGQHDLDVDIGGAGMAPAASCSQQLGDEAAEHDELGASAVVVHDPHEGSLGGRPSSPGSFGVSHGPPSPGDAPPPLRPERR